MQTSLVYRSTWLYESAMVLLYGRHYAARYHALAELVPERASVLDVCCGPGILYYRYLKQKQVDYLGIDINQGFVDRLARHGARGQVCDLRADAPLPSADYVIMQASLYQFLPDARPVVDRMLRAAHQRVIVAEPIRNLSSSGNRWLAMFGARMSDAGDGELAHRFNETTFDAFFAHYSARLESTCLIPGGREKIVVLRADA